MQHYSQQSPPTALVIEDERANRAILSNVFRARGFDVVIAENGAEGLLEFIRNPEIQVVTLDLRMSEVDGFTVLKVIEALYCSGKLSGPGKIIVHSEVSNFEELRSITGLRCVHSIRPKPLNRVQLESDIQMIVDSLRWQDLPLTV